MTAGADLAHEILRTCPYCGACPATLRSIDGEPVDNPRGLVRCDDCGLVRSRAELLLARVGNLPDEWGADADAHEETHRVESRTMRSAASELRALLNDAPHA